MCSQGTGETQPDRSGAYYGYVSLHVVPSLLSAWQDSIFQWCCAFKPPHEAQPHLPLCPELPTIASLLIAKDARCSPNCLPSWRPYWPVPAWDSSGSVWATPIRWIL